MARTIEFLQKADGSFYLVCDLPVILSVTNWHINSYVYSIPFDGNGEWWSRTDLSGRGLMPEAVELSDDEVPGELKAMLTLLL